MIADWWLALRVVAVTWFVRIVVRLADLAKAWGRRVVDDYHKRHADEG